MLLLSSEELSLRELGLEEQAKDEVRAMVQTAEKQQEIEEEIGKGLCDCRNADFGLRSESADQQQDQRDAMLEAHVLTIDTDFKKGPPPCTYPDSMQCVQNIASALCYPHCFPSLMLQASSSRFVLQSTCMSDS